MLGVANKLTKYENHQFNIKCSSFAANTLIWQQDTQQAISQLAIGDKVYSRSEQSYNDHAQIISRTLHRTTPDYYQVTTETNNILQVTAEHPFWVQSEGWVEASKLQPGNVVATINGDILIRHIEHINQPLDVFNLSITNTPSYFAGDDGLWVHNANIDCELDGGKSSIQIASEGEKHAGQLKQFLKQTPEQLQKTIHSFDKLIAKHQAWIKNPTSKIKNFNSFQLEHQKNIIHHWKQDIVRHQELKSIAQDVLKGL